jgi:hypothetical protein
MDADDFRETVANAKATELGRLGSSKLLIALTDADMTDERVLAAAAHSEAAARETFEHWAGDERDADARDLFASVAEREATHYDRVVADLPAAFEPATGGPMHAYLQGLDETVPRVAAGLVGRGLVSLETHLQVVGYFVNEADREHADLFRDLRSETEDSLRQGLAFLDERLDEPDEWATARGPAEYVIQLAYDDYADSLGELGVDPKPLC